MRQPIFSNRAQIVQTVFAVVMGILALVAYYGNQAGMPVSPTVWFSLLVLAGIVAALPLLNLWVGGTPSPVPEPVPGSIPEIKLTRHEVYIDYSERPGIHYKMKLRVELRNESSDCVEVDNVQWDPGPKGIPPDPVRSRVWWRIQAWRAVSNPDPSVDPRWQVEEEHVHVPVGHRFRVSIALDPTYGEARIKKSIADSETGTVSLRVKIDQHTEEKHFKI